MKEIVAYTLFILLLVALFPLQSRTRIYWLVALIFYPVVLKIFARDAFTVSTLLIYFYATPASLRYILTKRHDSMNMHCMTMIIMAIATTSQLAGDLELFLPAVRQLSNFMSAIILFMLIINVPDSEPEELQRHSNNLLTILIYSTLIQCAISIVMLVAPSSRSLFSFFSYGSTTTFEAVSIVATFSRLNSLIMPFEAMSEFIALMSPIILYKFFSEKRIKWITIYIVLFFVLCLNQTRSGFILFIGCGVIYMLTNIRMIGVRPLIYVGLSGFAAIAFAFEYSDTLFSGIIARLEQTSDVLNKSSEVFKVINREGFYYNMVYLFNSLKPLGHGLISPIYYKVITNHFHNLWQTIIFQFGYIGAPFVFAVFLKVFWRAIQFWKLTKLTRDRLLGSAILLSLVLFFINESKYEFNRYEGYQQIIWAYLGTVYWLCHGALAHMPAADKNRDLL